VTIRKACPRLWPSSARRLTLLASLDERHVTAFIETHHHNATLKPTSPIGCYHGDVLYFRSMHDNPIDIRPSDL
jgi:hypothetical protein